jgi:hypothetical protein
MERCYSVAQNGDQKWVVSVHGQEVMLCTRKTDAVQAAKEAARLLAQLSADVGSRREPPGVAQAARPASE